MNDQATDTDNVGRLDNPISCITNQSSSYPLALKRLVNCQPAKYNNRDGIGHVAAKSARRFSYSYGT